MMATLRLNQGDPSEARIYYCPHFVAAELGLFHANGVDVSFVWTESTGSAVTGGQIPAVLSGTADLTIGGPMVTMRMWQEGERELVGFCGVVAANPWYLAARHPVADFSWEWLRGRTVLDVANIPTASLCFRWLLRARGLPDGAVRLVPGSGDEAADFAAVQRGAADVALHSLHALAPHLAEGSLSVVADLATATGPVPWSAYIARREVLRRRRPEFVAFTRAIAAALRWMHVHPAADIAALVAPRYPGYALAGLLEGIGRYRAVGVWPADARIPQAEFDHFSRILTEIGWLDRPVAYADLVDPTLAEEDPLTATDQGRTTA